MLKVIQDCPCWEVEGDLRVTPRPYLKTGETVEIYRGVSKEDSNEQIGFKILYKGRIVFVDIWHKNKFVDLDGSFYFLSIT